MNVERDTAFLRFDSHKIENTLRVKISTVDLEWLNINIQ
jgi:hypothetical protein